MRSIVRHEALRGTPRQDREAPLDDRSGLVSWESPAADVYHAELRRLLLAAIDELPPTFREVVQLQNVEERSNAEVSPPAAHLQAERGRAAATGPTDSCGPGS